MPEVDTQTIEIGMSGMRLLNCLADDGGRKPSTTSSTVSTSPPDDDIVSSPHHFFAEHGLSLRGSAPPSPNNGRDQGPFIGHTRPPGLSCMLPSPISKLGNSKNTSSTSPSLTLTPNSSADGHSDWNSVGRQASPYTNLTDPPSLPFLHGEHRRSRDVSSFGSIDFMETGNDGLMGLNALRERALSSPGVVSSSPPIQGKTFGSTDSDRPRPRDRPPRSSQPAENFSVYSGDRVGPFTMPYSVPNSRNETSNTSLESNDSRSFGAIGRPDMRHPVPDYEMNRMRTSSADYQYSLHQQQQAAEHKFGTLPTLGSHLQHHRVTESYTANLPKPRHVRSVSQPVQHFGSFQQLPPYGNDPRMYQVMNSVQSSRHSTSMSGPIPFKESGSLSRSVSGSHTVLSSSYDSSRGKGASMPNLGGGYSQNSYANLQRRDALDFDEARIYTGSQSMISPGQSPLQNHYAGTHSRQASDPGIGLLSSSPLSVGSGVMRVSGSSSVHARHDSDDDLANPLVGEHIEVPADHDDLNIQSSYILGHSGHSLARSSGSIHSLSLNDMHPHYIESPLQLPTAGATLHPPRIIYIVKFKRTQRNFVLGPRINRDLKIGTYVKVEADRGEDLGIVVGKGSADKFGLAGRGSFTAGMGPIPALVNTSSSVDLKRIIRLATHDEVSLLSLKREEEDELLQICRAKVRQRGLPMNVVDAEYQFDRHKLTFFLKLKAA